jgi:hypothetical protein
MNFKQIVILLLVLGSLSLSISKGFTKTLIISDSHGTGAFGSKLTNLFESQKEEVSFFAYGGTTAIDWIEGNNLTWGFWEHQPGLQDVRSTNQAAPIFEKLLKKIKPSQVIIVLGTNLLWRERLSKDAASIQTLLNLSREMGAKCFWVGPPDLKPKYGNQQRRVLEIHQQLEQEIPGTDCALIKSWNFTTYPQSLGDGIHYDQIQGNGQELAEAWAARVFKEVTSPKH